MVIEIFLERFGTFWNFLEQNGTLTLETFIKKYDKNKITIAIKNVVRGVDMKKCSELDAAKQQLVEELEAARLIALETKSSAAMVSASIGKAKILGLISEKTKKENEDDKSQINPVLVKFIKTDKEDQEE